MGSRGGRGLCALGAADKASVSASWSWNAKTKPPEMHTSDVCGLDKIKTKIGLPSWAHGWWLRLQHLQTVRVPGASHSSAVLVWCISPLGPLSRLNSAVPTSVLRSTLASHEGEDLAQSWLLLQLRSASASPVQFTPKCKMIHIPFAIELGLILSKLLNSHPTSRTIVFKPLSHLVTCQKCKFSGHAPDLLNQKFLKVRASRWFDWIPQGSIVSNSDYGQRGGNQSHQIRNPWAS